MLCLAGSTCLQSPAFAAVVDRVIAVVGNEAIFASDIENRAVMARLQYPELANDKALSRSILDGLIDQKTILSKAKIDSVSIDLSSLDAMTKERLRQVRSRFASTSEMEARLGKSTVAIRENLREELRSQQLIETLRRKKTADVTVTYAEVMDFYKNNRAQLPVIPEALSVSQIIKYPAVSAESRARSLATITRLQAELKQGANFAELAAKYSDDPGSAKMGGDLGVARRGQFIPSFEKAAYALKEGGISDVVETRYGFHVIQMLSKEENSIHVRHILIGFDRSVKDASEPLRQLNEAYNAVVSGKVTFGELAKQYSDDPTSAAVGGVIMGSGTSPTILSPSMFSPQMQKVIDGLKKPGDVSKPEKMEPQRGEIFYAIFQLNGRIPAHTPDPEKDYTYLAELARNNKSQKVLSDWMEQLRKEVYVRTSDI
jgi:peptidyl-prolyl cis-trans isomerase SurA